MAEWSRGVEPGLLWSQSAGRAIRARPFGECLWSSDFGRELLSEFPAGATAQIGLSGHSASTQFHLPNCPRLLPFIFLMPRKTKRAGPIRGYLTETMLSESQKAFSPMGNKSLPGLSR